MSHNNRHHLLIIVLQLYFPFKHTWAPKNISSDLLQSSLRLSLDRYERNIVLYAPRFYRFATNRLSMRDREGFDDGRPSVNDRWVV